LQAIFLFQSTPPTNDEPAGAIVIDTASLPSSWYASLNGATASNVGCYSGWADIWYAFTVSEAQQMSLSVDSWVWEAGIALFAGDLTTGASIVMCSTNFTFDASPGITYYIAIAGPYDQPFWWSLQRVSAPANDLRGNATPVSLTPGQSYSDGQNMRGATRSDDDPYGSCGGYDPNVWYALSTPEGGTIRATIGNPTGSAYVTVWQGTGPDDLQLLTCSGYSLNFASAAGATYYIEVQASVGSSGVSLQLDNRLAPSNDLIENATEVRFDQANPWVGYADLAGATRSPGDPQWCNSSPNVWYKLVLTEARYINFAQSGETLEIYQGAPGSLSGVTCFSSGELLLQPGTYYIAQMGTSTADLQVEDRGGPPANDDRANAIDISNQLGQEFVIDLNHATRDWSTDPCACWCANNVWYTLLLTQPRLVEFVQDRSYGVVLWKEQGGGLQYVGCGSDFTALLDAGVRYYVESTSYQSGVHFKTVDQGPPLKITLTVNPNGTANSKTGAATIGGTLICNKAASATVKGTLRQTLGRKTIIEGTWSTPVQCSGPTPWTAVVRSSQGAYGGGAAEALTNANAYTSNESVQTDATAVIKLKGGGK
jgi:hypothetical protein